MTRITYYHILGISSDATEDEITMAFRRKVKQWHPDVCRHPDAEERMREINEAAEVLCDPERRLRYDRALTGKGKPEPGHTEDPQTPAKPGRFHDWFIRAGQGLSSIRIRPETVRFAATACSALLILGVIIFTAITLIPQVAGPFIAPSTPITTIATIPVPPGISPALSQDALFAAHATGDTLYASGDYEGAVQAYDTVIAEKPESVDRELWYNRGMALSALGLYSEAADSFDQVLRTSPDDTFALAQKGAALIGLGRYDESLQYTDRALSGESDTAWIWNNRGIALAGLGQEKEARMAFENAIVFAGRTGTPLYQSIVARSGSVSGF